MTNKGGRPKAQIKKDQFEALCAMQATKEEMCHVLGVTEKTLQRWCRDTYGGSFSLIFSQKRALGKASLRRMQWKLAEKSPAMAIFLGKNYLDQTDKVEQEVKVYNDDEAVKEMHEYFKGTSTEPDKK